MRRRKSDKDKPEKNTVTRKFSYKAYKPKINCELVEAQMYRAHRYRNSLVELERNRREQVEKTLRELFPQLVELDATIKNKKAELEALRKTIKSRNQAARSRTQTTPEERAAIAAIKAELKSLWPQHKELKKTSFASAPWQARQKSINQEFESKWKELRRGCKGELFWGTYLQVEYSMDRAKSGPPPVFHAWTGDSKVAVQTQNGMTVDDLLKAEDKRLRLIMKGDQRHGKVMLRIGSSDKREPVWAEFPVIMHRPLPRDGMIKWATLLRRRVGTQYQWSFQVDIETPPLTRVATTTHKAGIDVGWRPLDTGLRVAYWVGSDGREEQLLIPYAQIERWNYCDKLQSFRDQHFDLMRNLLYCWLTSHECPQWLSEASQNIAHWKSQKRLAKLVMLWKKNRFDGDNESVQDAAKMRKELKLEEKHYGTPTGLFDLMHAWQLKDRHLYDWISYQRLGFLRWRDHVYREFAAKICGHYTTIKVEDCNWSHLMRNKTPESETNDGAIKEYQRVAAVGRLIRILSERAVQFQKVPSQRTTMIHFECGKLSGQIKREELMHTCQHCGVPFDQDRNAALNILASNPVVDPAPKIGDSEESQNARAGDK